MTSDDSREIILCTVDFVVDLEYGYVALSMLIGNLMKIFRIEAPFKPSGPQSFCPHNFLLSLNLSSNYEGDMESPFVLGERVVIDDVNENVDAVELMFLVCFLICL